MDVELFVYGVPHGEDFWGKEEDRKYFGTLYNGSSDEVKFLIQTRSLNGRAYCYYNYMVYKDVVDNDGRAGAYFGISLRFDAYCKDIMNMYRILDTIYNVYVLGSLLKADKSKLRYAVSSFASASGTLRNIEDVTLQLVQEAFSNDSFTGLSGFPTSGSNCPTCNLYDCTTENVLDAIKKYGKVAISPYYPSGKETTMQKRHEKQIKDMQQDYEARLLEEAKERNEMQQRCKEQIDKTQQDCEDRLRKEADVHALEKKNMTSSLAALRSQVKELNTQVSEKGEQIATLEKEVSHLKSKISKTKQAKKIFDIVTSVQDSIFELEAVLRKNQQKSTEGKKENKNKENRGGFPVIKFIKALLPFINFIILVLMAFCTL